MPQSATNKKIEMWGIAQREAAWGRTSDWGDNLWAEILFLRTPPGNATALDSHDTILYSLQPA